ncbi:hypothetical protein GJV85_05810 [Sulfurimonas aquatica]|uniref:Cytochrome c domain-containing protein n=1 Tax=Sulfurimonas aquatica TaxID=2672570 RepID=A0A975B015_9BACT|nr:hypothetical protein [Sulfurimonas aquatica]QSZ41640.1 hypothetical protein GJV85_05810 [Sulfurimonas aquatica]
MKSLLLHSLIISTIIFTGCNTQSTDDDSGGANANTQVSNDTQTNDSAACTQDYFDSTISISLNSCVSCHSSGGDAKNTDLVLLSPVADNKLGNYNILKTYIESPNSELVEKGSGEVSHAGGTQLAGTAKENMKQFVNYVKGSETCVSQSQSDSLINAAVALLSPAKTLRSASYKIQGKSPSSDDVDSVSKIEDIDAKLDAYMQTDAFYDWLRLSFNDFLLTDFYTPGRNAEDLLSSNDFPSRRWYDDFDDGEYSRLRYYTNYAISREPIELMLHVIKEDRPFSEILTADYVMVNPFSARTYNIDIDGFTYVHELNVTREYIEEKYPQDWLKEAKIDGIPHAGIFTTITFLNRFPSTDTNLDRHRSSKTQLFFLDTDILGLANRPINSNEVLSDTATWTNPNCTVCHNVMEPISSAFKNWDNRGRYMPGFRGDATQAAGISLEKKAPADASNNLLQWLSGEIVKDDRFAKSSVKIFYKAILGREAIKKPLVDDMEYVEKLQVYNYENAILDGIKEKFIASGMNAKVIIKELIKSPLFRATSTTSSNTVLSETLGQAKLITPENLNRKIYDVMGYYWNRYMGQQDSDNNNTANHRLLRDDNYKILYGGINSGSISTRIDELNGVMANVQMRMALQMSCYPVARDFFFPADKRKLFPYVSTTLEPENEFFIAAIKKNIQYLHKHILGEELADSDEELEKTYQLFLDTYNDGKLRILNSSESKQLMDECDVHYDPVTREGLWTDRPDERVYRDPNYIIRSWQVVVAYLLSDFKFVYENSAE